MDVGETYSEPESLRDPLAGRDARRLTTCGRINQTPSYHTNSGFAADGRYLVFASVRERATWAVRAQVATGELKALWRSAGVGDRSYVHRGMALDFADVDGRGICGNRVCMAPRSRLVVFTCERTIYAVEIETCQARVLLEDCGAEWIFGAPCVSPDEKHVAIALSSAHPELLAGKPATHRYVDFPDHKLRLTRVPTDGSGRAEAPTSGSRPSLPIAPSVRPTHNCCISTWTCRRATGAEATARPRGSGCWTWRHGRPSR